MISIDTLEELQRYLKVNSDFDISYLEPFYHPANTMLRGLTGVDPDSIDNEEYLEHCKRYVAVAALTLSKGMQNVKMTSSGFTRYSESAKNAIAASSDAMKAFSDDLSTYLILCEEAVLALLESLSPAGWANSVFSTLLDGPVKTAEEVAAHCGVSVTRKQLRSAKSRYQQAIYRAERTLGEETLSRITARESEVAKTAYSYYCTILAQVVAAVDAEPAWSMLEDYVLCKFGQPYSTGVTNMEGGIGL